MRRLASLLTLLVASVALGQGRLSVSPANVDSAISARMGFGSFPQMTTMTPVGVAVFNTSGGQLDGGSSPTPNWLYDGTEWRPLVANGVAGKRPKLASNFSAVNAGSCTFADRNGALHVVMPTASGSTTFHGWGEDLSAATAYVEFAFLDSTTNGVNTAFPGRAIFMREKGTGKILTLEVSQITTPANNALFIQDAVWTSNTARASANAFSFSYSGGPLFLRIRRASTNTLTEYSVDRANWITLTTRTTTTVFTTAPDQVGVAALSYANTERAEFDVVSYLSGS